MNQDYNKQLQLGTQLLTKSTKFNELECTIYNSNFSLKLKDITNKDDYKKLVDVVVSWRYYLGIKEQITTEELEFIVKYIKDEYSHFTIEMIECAIKTSLKGLLNVDIKPYGAFSALYVSTILTAYKRYNDKVVSAVITENSKEAVKEYTDEEKYVNRLKYLEYYQSACEIGYIIDFKDIMWQVLLKNKKVNELMLDRFDIKAEATKMCEREKMKTDITKAILVDEIDLIKASKYLLMKPIIKEIDFKTIEIL